VAAAKLPTERGSSCCSWAAAVFQSFKAQQPTRLESNEASRWSQPGCFRLGPVSFISACPGTCGADSSPRQQGRNETPQIRGD
jgi:hypothetical protein